MPAWVSLTFFQHSLAKSAIYIWNIFYSEISTDTENGTGLTT